MDWSQAGYAVPGFLVPFLATVAAAFLARRRSASGGGDELAGRQLGRWAVGLSAATTGSSGFIVTGAVGLGYTTGAGALLLPLGWLAGDLIFWALFPGRLNALARDTGAVTIPELIAHPFSGRWKQFTIAASAILIFCLLMPYASAQWMAGQKIVGGVFGLPPWQGILVVACLVISYSTIGGFRGSVYTDLVQAVIRIGGTLLALGSLVFYAANMPAFAVNIRAAGPPYLSMFSPGFYPVLGILFGFAGAAIGFGLGQPQVTSRYLAGQSPDETQAARWIYILFVQGTWVAMTVFGILLRGVIPGLADPETGLSAFFSAKMNPFLAGVIFADIFATIAATANGILVAIAQIFRRNLLPSLMKTSAARNEVTVALVGALSIGLSLLLPGSVAQTIIVTASLFGAGLGGAVLIRAMGWRCNGLSMFCAILTGILTGLAWRIAGFADHVNESAIGLLAAILVNALVVRSMDSFRYSGTLANPVLNYDEASPAASESEDPVRNS